MGSKIFKLNNHGNEKRAQNYFGIDISNCL